MRTKNNRILLLAALIAGVSMTTAVSADPGKGKGPLKDKGHKGEVHRSYNDDGKVSFDIGNTNRDIIRDYIRRDYRTNCPPGLAKKSPACVPPGQAKKWSIGHRLPDDLNYYPIDRALLDLLGPVPSGYEYVRVDKDILLIGEATKKVIDAVTLISAID